jgi:hypothetical protein
MESQDHRKMGDRDKNQGNTIDSVPIEHAAKRDPCCHAQATDGERAALSLAA